MEEFSDGGSTPPASTIKNNHTVRCGYFYGYREKLKCSAEVNSASAKVLSRWLKTLVRHESAAPLCGDLGSAAQRAVPLCRFPPQMMKC